jgi:hypothetical protein
MVMLACPSHANAQTATWTGTVNGTTYNFSTITGTYADNASLLQSQVWWGNGDLKNLDTANQFMNAVGFNLGTPNFGRYSPFLAFKDSSPGNYINVVYSDTESQIPEFGLLSVDAYNPVSAPYDYPYTYIVANAVNSVAVPEIDASKLPIAGFVFGTFMLWMFARRRQERQGIGGDLAFA